MHDLLAVVGASKRDGPGRGPLIELGQAVDDVLDALERRPKRAGRAWLLVEQPDTELAIRGDCARGCTP